MFTMNMNYLKNSLKKISLVRLAIFLCILCVSIAYPSDYGVYLSVASGAVVLAPTKGSRYIVDVTFAATDTSFAITHGLADPLSIGMAANTVGTVNPTGLTWTRTSAAVITINHDSLTNAAILLRVELANPSTIS